MDGARVLPRADVETKGVTGRRGPDPIFKNYQWAKYGQNDFYTLVHLILIKIL